MAKASREGWDRNCSPGRDRSAEHIFCRYLRRQCRSGNARVWSSACCWPLRESEDRHGIGILLSSHSAVKCSKSFSFKFQCYIFNIWYHIIYMIIFICLMDDRHASLKDTSDDFCGTVRRASRRKQDLQGKQQLLLAQHRQACEPCNRLSLCPRAHTTTVRSCYYRILYIDMFHALNIFRSQIIPLLCGFQAEQDRNYARKA